MLRSQADGDQEAFFSIALQVAAAEARQGRRSTAEEIRHVVAAARHGSRETGIPVQLGTPDGELADVLELRQPRWNLDDVVLEKSLRARLDYLIRQQTKRDQLREHGKAPNRRLLLVGPPGSGKTMTAEALARSLNLNLYVVRLESMITRFMGETSAKLRLVFAEANRRRGVYLFDEFDAIGGRRDATNDVGEMRRVLNSFLTMMEEPTATDSLIVAATNHTELLDRALLRRFDEVLQFEIPTAAQIERVVRANLRPKRHPRLGWKSVTAAAEGLSQAEIARAAEDAVKEAILDERDVIRTNDVVRRLRERQAMREAFSAAK